MPFTVTHMVAIVPIARVFRWLPFSALAIGCMVPDLPLFFPAVPYSQTHSLLGVLTLCTPLGMAAYLVFQCLLKVPLLALMPTWVQARMTAYAKPVLRPSYLFFLNVALAVTIGAYTHVCWDTFTHQGRWGTQLLPFLNQEVVLLGRVLPVAKLFQFGSSLVGLPLLIWLWARQLIRTEPVALNSPDRLSSGTKAISITVLSLAPSLAALLKFLADGRLEEKLFRAVTAGGATLMAAAMVYAILFQAFAMRRTYEQCQSVPE